MNIEMVKHLGMSDKLRNAWENLETGTFAEVADENGRYEVIANFLRREQPDAFNLRMPGDCWVWCFAIQDTR